MSDRRLSLEALIKQLPPSASTLRLLDLTGALGDSLAARRADILVAAGLPAAADADTFDAVMAWELLPDDPLLRGVLGVLRPGGRLVVLDSAGDPSAALVKRLEAAGYTRILAEELSETGGLLLRGEKPHVTDDTLARIAGVASLDSGAFKGRYVHLLVRQTPNKPAWALRPGEPVTWDALALAVAGEPPVLLAFSSLPNAVAFMQPAVLAGAVRDVNKVAKFSRETAQGWSMTVNPSVEILKQHPTVLIPVDPALAETPDE